MALCLITERPGDLHGKEGVRGFESPVGLPKNRIAKRFFASPKDWDNFFWLSGASQKQCRKGLNSLAAHTDPRVLAGGRGGRRSASRRCGPPISSVTRANRGARPRTKRARPTASPREAPTPRPPPRSRPSRTARRAGAPRRNARRSPESRSRPTPPPHLYVACGWHRVRPLLATILADCQEYLSSGVMIRVWTFVGRCGL